MNASLLAAIYVICAAIALLVRLFFMMKIGERESRKGSLLDQFLIVMIVASMVLPLVYILTPLLNFANYSLPDTIAWFGIVLIVGSLLMLWRSHADLGTNFALTPSIHGKQSLIKQGVYRRVRHPMYASLWLWAFSMPFLLHNYIMGFIFLIVFTTFYIVRVPLEEEMMKERFGKEYEDYVEETGSVFPKMK